MVIIASALKQLLFKFENEFCPLSIRRSNDRATPQQRGFEDRICEIISGTRRRQSRSISCYVSGTTR